MLCEKQVCALSVITFLAVNRATEYRLGGAAGEFVFRAACWGLFLGVKPGVGKDNGAWVWARAASYSGWSVVNVTPYSFAISRCQSSIVSCVGMVSALSVYPWSTTHL